MKSRLVTKLGAFSYGAAVIFNKGINALLRPLTGREIRFSKAIKHWVKRKVRSVEDFQQKAIDVALEKEADYLVCGRSEEHTSELQSLMRISYAVFCLKKKNSLDTYTHWPSYRKA